MRLSMGDGIDGAVGVGRDEELQFTGRWRFEARRADGSVKWIEEGKNIIVDEGIDYIFNNDLAAASLYIGLIGAGTPAASWTMTEAGGSSGAPSDSNGDREIHSEYDEAARQAWTVVDSTAKTVTNTASKATFTFNGSISVTGGFLSTVSTKNNQTGTLVAAKTFTSAKAMDNGETLQVTYEITGSSS